MMQPLRQSKVCKERYFSKKYTQFFIRVECIFVFLAKNFGKYKKTNISFDVCLRVERVWLALLLILKLILSGLPCLDPAGLG